MDEVFEEGLDWMVYWWMAPVSVFVATAAMSFGVGGAVLFSPVFVVVFPLVGVPALSPATAFGAALMTELVGFSSGLVGYQRKGFVHWDSVRRIVWFSIPLAVIATFGKRLIPAWILLLSFAVGMFGLAAYLRHNMRQKDDKAKLTEPGSLSETAREEGDGDLVDGTPNENGDVEAGNGENVVTGHDLGPVDASLRTRWSYSLMAVGSFMTGLSSVGIGETCVTSLQCMWGLPMNVAAGTSVAIVMITVLSSALAEVIAVGVEEVPWNLVCYTMPGVLIGGQIGVRVSSKIPERTAEKILFRFFLLLGVLMTIVAVTMMDVL